MPSLQLPLMSMGERKARQYASEANNPEDAVFWLAVAACASCELIDDDLFTYDRLYEIIVPLGHYSNEVGQSWIGDILRSEVAAGRIKHIRDREYDLAGLSQYQVA